MEKSFIVGKDGHGIVNLRKEFKIPDVYFYEVEKLGVDNSETAKRFGLGKKF